MAGDSDVSHLGLVAALARGLDAMIETVSYQVAQAGEYGAEALRIDEHVLPG